MSEVEGAEANKSVQSWFASNIQHGAEFFIAKVQEDEPLLQKLYQKGDEEGPVFHASMAERLRSMDIPVPKHAKSLINRFGEDVRTIFQYEAFVEDEALTKAIQYVSCILDVRAGLKGRKKPVDVVASGVQQSESVLPSRSVGRTLSAPVRQTPATREIDAQCILEEVMKEMQEFQDNLHTAPAILSMLRQYNRMTRSMQLRRQLYDHGEQQYIEGGGTLNDRD
jgi:hypothetical protein